MTSAVHRRPSLALAVAVLLGALLVSAPAPAGISDDALEDLREFVRNEMEAQKIPGVTVGFRHGDTTWVDGFGFADLENRTPTSPESAYRLASVTKTMTAIAVLKLVEMGKIDLDAEVQTYVDYFPKKEHPVTVRQVLGHLGGISHYRNYDEEGHFTDHKDTREAIAVFESFDLVAEPGTEYNYSSYGYNLLGAVVEGASDESFGDFMRDQVWQPLGMESTRMDDPDALIPNRVRGYRMTDSGELINSEFVNISSRFAAGGTRSTVPDLLRYTAGLKPGRILSGDTLDAMWTSMVTADGQPTDYGMGWSVVTFNGRFAVAHGGGQAETRTFLLYVPSEDLTVAVAMNFEGGDRMPFVRRMASTALGEAIVPTAYAGGRGPQTIYNALGRLFDAGAGYHDRYGRAVTDDAEALAAAFDYLNDNLEAAAKGKDIDEVREAINRGLNVHEGAPLQTAGSFMAASLAAELGPEEYRELRAGGPLPFVARYAELGRSGDVKKPHRISKSVEKTLQQWNEDWGKTWNARVQDADPRAAGDVSAALPVLKAEFAGASIYPNFWPHMQDKLETAYRNRQIPTAVQLAQAGRELYPELDGPHFYSGLLALAGGDMENATALIAHARELNPSGMARAGSLNRWAYNFNSIGMVDAGLAVLSIARQFYPEDANLHDSTGELYLAKGDTEQAIAHYKKALEINPEFESARRMLAEIESREEATSATAGGK